jgi:hypothetical protein
MQQASLLKNSTEEYYTEITWPIMFLEINQICHYILVFSQLNYAS